MIYERLARVEEFVLLILYPSTVSKALVHLPSEFVAQARREMRSSFVVLKGKTYQTGTPEFYFSQLKYVNNLISKILCGYEDEFKLDFSTVQQLKKEFRIAVTSS